VATARQRNPETTAATVVAALHRLARGLRTHRQSVATRHGLTPLQLDLIRTLADGPPPEPLVGLLAFELGVTQPTVTDSLRALESKGLLERRSAPLDRRRTESVLTPAGRTLLGELNAADEKVIASVATLPAEVQEGTLGVVLVLINSLLDAGIINVARNCLSCRFHESSAAADHRCALLDAVLSASELRFNCPDHQAS
jgi:DNA-binding MarR family transcriptional regulator